ncbi:hypothetical protein GYMLUDRAFT_35874 [Collybiopsis luxurians FD-317 M1]|nr:hypothetical protein GYMLUDRAFT_35874 [Collybiopsis luxurians FD-317 M1]
MDQSFYNPSFQENSYPYSHPLHARLDGHLASSTAMLERTMEPYSWTRAEWSGHEAEVKASSSRTWVTRNVEPSDPRHRDKKSHKREADKKAEAKQKSLREKRNSVQEWLKNLDVVQEVSSGGDYSRTSAKDRKGAMKTTEMSMTGHQPGKNDEWDITQRRTKEREIVDGQTSMQLSSTTFDRQFSVQPPLLWTSEHGILASVTEDLEQLNLAVPMSTDDDKRIDSPRAVSFMREGGGIPQLVRVEHPAQGENFYEIPEEIYEQVDSFDIGSRAERERFNTEIASAFSSQLQHSEPRRDGKRNMQELRQSEWHLNKQILDQMSSSKPNPLLASPRDRELTFESPREQNPDTVSKEEKEQDEQNTRSLAEEMESAEGIRLMKGKGRQVAGENEKVLVPMESANVEEDDDIDVVDLDSISEGTFELVEFDEKDAVRARKGDPEESSQDGDSALSSVYIV